MFDTVGQHDFASQAWLDNCPTIDHPLNEQMSNWFALLFLSEQGDSPSDYLQRSAQADRSLKFYYYAQPQELAARAFEALIQDHSIKNAFLVQGTKQSVEAKLGIYPTDGHRASLAQPLYQYFYQLGQALQRSKG